MVRKILCYLSGFIVLIALIACSSHEDEPDVPAPPSSNEIVKTVAVVVPIGDAATKTRLERTAQWFQDNFAEAQQGDTTQIRLQLEWHDELTEDLTALSQQLAARDDILAVIGPFSNDNLALFAPACKRTQKPLIAPTATSEEIIRRYVVPTATGQQETSVFLWPLCETDVRLTETMMDHYVTQTGKYAEYAALRCALFSPADSYGRTFYDWAPFHANNMGIAMQRNEQYATTSDLLASMTDYLNHLDVPDVLSNNFCVVETTQQLYEVVRLHNEWWKDYVENPTKETLYRTYFVFPSLSEEGLADLGDEAVKMLQGYQGFSPYADPATGFEQAYEERYGVKPTFAECKFDDALLLAGLAAVEYESIKSLNADDEHFQAVSNATFNACIFQVAYHDKEQASHPESVWTASRLRSHIHDLRNYYYTGGLCGAAGHIAFDLESGTQVALTTYVHWQIDNGQIRHLAYYGPDGKQVVSPSVAWDIFYDEETAMKDFASMAKDLDLGLNYPALTDQYAVLVQGSEGATNYRHLADVLSVYQLLRKGGFDDDHIILILDKQEAARHDNVIWSSYFSDDLMGGTDGLPQAVVDYDNHALNVSNIAEILKDVGGAGANVLFYWSGHGRSQGNGGSNEFEWLGTPGGQGFTADLLRQTANEMLTSGRCRKLLVIAEPCYAEATVNSLDGITGALAIVGASTAEQSWADNWNSEGLYWMSDRFTQNVVQQLTANPAITYRDLFLYCAQHTLGSHAKIVNAAHFGNLYTDSPQEFIIYNR